MLNKSQFSEQLLLAARNYMSNHQSLIALNIFIHKDSIEIENGFKYQIENFDKSDFKDLLNHLVEGHLIEKFEKQKKGVYKIWMTEKQNQSSFQL